MNVTTGGSDHRWHRRSAYVKRFDDRPELRDPREPTLRRRTALAIWSSAEPERANDVEAIRLGPPAGLIAG